MSGIPAEKIIAMRNIRDTAEYADITGIKKIAIYRGNYCIEDSDYVYKRLLERIREGK
jgi:hypothetical protein